MISQTNEDLFSDAIPSETSMAVNDVIMNDCEM